MRKRKHRTSPKVSLNFDSVCACRSVRLLCRLVKRMLQTDFQDFYPFLEEELRKLREETNVDSLRQELERERSKRLDLEQKMNEVLRTR